MEKLNKQEVSAITSNKDNVTIAAIDNSFDTDSFIKEQIELFQ